MRSRPDVDGGSAEHAAVVHRVPDVAAVPCAAAVDAAHDAAHDVAPRVPVQATRHD